MESGFRSNIKRGPRGSRLFGAWAIQFVVVVRTISTPRSRAQGGGKRLQPDNGARSNLSPRQMALNRGRAGGSANPAQTAVRRPKPRLRPSNRATLARDFAAVMALANAVLCLRERHRSCCCRKRIEFLYLTTDAEFVPSELRPGFAFQPRRSPRPPDNDLL